MYFLCKGPEWNPLLFAHPSTLNNEEPKNCMDPTFSVSDGATPYQQNYSYDGVHTTDGLSVI